MDAETQKALILDFAERHGSITVREASEILQINSPTARLSELRKIGLIDHEEWEYYIANNGRKKKYKRYFFRKFGDDHAC